MNFRSQDLPLLVAPNGAIWVSRAASLVKNKSFYATGHRFFEIPWAAGLDIDTEEDFLIAQIIAKANLGRNDP